MKIFYDKLIVFEKIEAEIAKVSQSKEEKEELWRIVDEMIHHKVLDMILKKLPKDQHQEFMDKFLAAPHDESLLDYLSAKIGDDAEKLIKKEMDALASEILKEIKHS